MNVKAFTFFLAFLTLSVSQWTALGTFTEENNMLSRIFTIIQTAMTNLTNLQSPELIPGYMTSSLNSQYGMGWNCIATIFFQNATTDIDAAIFGYAYNNHWLWINLPGLGTLIIWKDYNSVNYPPTIIVNLSKQAYVDALGPYTSSAQILTTSDLKAMAMLNAGTNPNVWNIAVRISDILHANFAGSYTVAVIENAQAVAASVGSKFSSLELPYFYGTFTHGTKKLTIFYLVTQDGYGGATRPTTTGFNPTCLTGNYLNTSIQGCS